MTWTDVDGIWTSNGPPSSLAPLLAATEGPLELRLGPGLDDPLWLPVLAEGAGRRLVVHAALEGLADDGPLRPLLLSHLLVAVSYPSVDDAVSRACGVDRIALEKAMRNLLAFAVPMRLEVPVSAVNVHTLMPTLDHLTRAFRGRRIVVRGTAGVEGVWYQLSHLEHDGLRPLPRIVLPDRAPEEVPMEDFPKLPLLPMAVGAGTSTADRERQRLAAIPLQERPGFRGHPLDQFDDAAAIVLLRPGHQVYAIVEPVREGRPYLVQGHGYGVAIAGRYSELLAPRFGKLCRKLRAEEPPDPTLGRLRQLAHVLRRGMRPRHDGEEVRLREEGE